MIGHNYPATTFVVAEPWGQILRATVVPHIEFNFSFLFVITGAFGTTISPYMFFWQASQEVEEELAAGLSKDDLGRPSLPVNFIRNMRIDTIVGMVSSELVQWFIIVTTGSVLYNHGVRTINTAADAARALEPLVRSFPNPVKLLGILGRHKGGLVSVSLWPLTLWGFTNGSF